MSHKIIVEVSHFWLFERKLDILIFCMPKKQPLHVDHHLYQHKNPIPLRFGLASKLFMHEFNIEECTTKNVHLHAAAIDVHFKMKNNKFKLLIKLILI